jgi:flavin reductase (DIM6/NTAB) family NADH-FMN oxidoreductase RutF/DNA-binding IclR family transcriptional regulator
MTTSPSLPAAMPDMTEFSSVDFRRSLGEFITGVTVITTVGPDGRRYGLTANSFSSVSLDPPLILWSLRLNATNFPIYSTAETFAVNILAEDQTEVANRFAKSGPDRFEGVAFTEGSGGLPLIDGSVAQLECRKEASYPGGDHVVFIGRVQRIRNTGRKPLGLRSGKYMIVHPHAPAAYFGGVEQENIATLNAIHAARPLLEELGHETDRTVGLAVWGNLGPTIVWWWESSRALEMRMRCGLVVSLLNSSVGAVFAAYAPRNVTGPLLEAELARQEPGVAQRFKTHADVEAYLEGVRSCRLGSIVDVVVPGVNDHAHTAFSAPVFDEKGAIVLALVMVGEAREFGAGDPAIERLSAAAEALSARLGYRPEYLRHR